MKKQPDVARQSLSRLSLIYVVFYLSTTGIALMVAPLSSLKLLGSTGNYEPIFVRSVGIFMVALSMIVFQIVRKRIDSLVKTTIFVRIFFVVSFLGLWHESHDPLFLVIIGVVGFGLVLTTALHFRKS